MIMASKKGDFISFTPQMRDIFRHNFQTNLILFIAFKSLHCVIAPRALISTIISVLLGDMAPHTAIR